MIEKKKKKISKKNEKRKRDKAVFAAVRARGKCERCGSYTTLQCAHIFSRRYLSIRWDELNLLCLCSRCHFWAHDHPLFFSEWVKQYLGDVKYEELMMKANRI